MGRTRAVSGPGSAPDGPRVGLTRPLIEEKSHRVELRLPPYQVTVQGDATRLIQSVANILNNAAKYTPPAGTIGVVLEADAERARVQIRDNGSGMPPDLLPSVFELFTQGAHAMLLRAQGTRCWSSTRRWRRCGVRSPSGRTPWCSASACRTWTASSWRLACVPSPRRAARC